MANWAYTSYAIEGPTETLEKIYNALKDHPVKDDSHESWEGNILAALGIEWEPHSMEQDGNVVKFSGYYMRGFIENYYWNNDAKDVLRINAEEAWGITDFYKVLEKNIPDIRIYWIVEESGETVYATNDKEGKYFPERFYVDACINGNYQTEYFSEKDSVYSWLAKLTDNKISNGEDVEKFNIEHGDSDDYISIYEYDIIE